MKIVVVLTLLFLILQIYAQTDPANSFIQGPGMTKAVAGDPTTTIQIVTLDSSNATVPCGAFAPFSVDLQGPQNTTGILTNCLNGVYTAFYTVTIAGFYDLNVTYNGVPLKNVPQNPECVAAVINPQFSIASGSGTVGGIVGTIQTFYVLTRDRYNNVNTTCIPSIFQVQLTGAATLNGTVNACSTPFDGNYSITYTPLVAGGYDLSVLISGSPIKDSPFRVTYTPGPLSPANSVGSGAGTASTFAGDNSAVNIQAYDAYNNIISTCLPVQDYVNFTIRAVARIGGTIVTGTVTTCSNGIYSGSYNATVSGTYDVTVSYAAVNIKNSPFVVEVDASDIYAPLTVAQGTGLSFGQAGIPASFSILPRDRFNNIPDYCIPLNEWINFNISLNNPSYFIQGSVLGCTNGVYTAQWTGQIRGSYTLTVTYKSTGISGSPFSTFLESGLISALNTFATGPGVTTARAGTSSWFVIHTYDQYQNKIYGCESPDQFTRWGINLVGAASVTGVISSCDSGNYTANYTTSAVGLYRMTVDYLSDPILGSPFDITGGPGYPYPPNCIATGIAYTITAGDTQVFAVFCSDIFNNAITTCEPLDSWALGFVGNNYTWDTCSAGNYSGQYNTTVSGNYQLFVEYVPDNQNIKDAPFSITVLPGPLDVLRSSAVGPGVDPIQIAAAATTFTIVSRDRYGNPVTTCLPLADWSVAISGSGLPDIPAILNNCNGGNYSVDYTPVVAGNYVINVRYNGSGIFGSPYPITVQPGQIDARTTYAEGSGLSGAVAGQTASFIIVTRDVVNNTGLACLNSSLYGNFEIRFTGPEALNGTIIGCAGGNYTVNWVGYIAGTYTLDILFLGTAIYGSPYSPTVVPGAINANTTFATGAGIFNATAGENTTFEINARDLYDNVITVCLSPSSWVQFVVRISTSPVVYGYVFACNNGVYNASFNATAAGVYSLDVTIGSDPIKDSPFTVVIYPAAFDYMSTLVTGEGTTTNGTAGTIRPFDIISKDRFGNDVADCYALTEWSSGLSGVADVLVTIFNCANGTYNASYNATVAGNYNLIVAYQNNTIRATPIPIAILPGPVYPPSSKTVNVTNALIGELVDFGIISADRFGNVINFCPSLDYANWTVLLVNGTLRIPGQVYNCLNGVFIGNYQSNESAIFLLYVQYNSVDISDSPLTVIITSGTIYAPNTIAYGPGVSDNIVAAGENADFFIEARNQYNFVIPDCQEYNDTYPFTFAATPAITTQQIQIIDCVNGNYTARYITTLAAKYSITINYASQNIKNNPYSATIKPGPVYPPYTLLSGQYSGNISNPNGSFVMTSRDQYQNLITSGGAPFGCALQPACRNASSSTVTDNNDGTYTCAYVLNNGGLFCLQVLYDGRVIGSTYSTACGAVADAEARRDDTVVDNLYDDGNFTFDIYIVGGAGCEKSCNNNGLCNSGNCFCLQGYEGPTCTAVKKEKKGLSDGAIAGIVIGIGIFLLIIGLLIGFLIGYFIQRKRGYVEILDRD